MKSGTNRHSTGSNRWAILPNGCQQGFVGSYMMLPPRFEPTQTQVLARMREAIAREVRTIVIMQGEVEANA